MNIKKLLVLFALITVTLACNFSDLRDMVQEEAGFTKCRPVDRATYEWAAEYLGEVPETPKYPEGAVYKVCFANANGQGGITSIRMSDGKRTNEGESDNPITSNQAESGNVTALTPADDEYVGSIPAGTYIGVNLEIPHDWELIEGEFIINIAADGTVSGSRIFIIKRESVSPTCTWRWENGHNTTISGHISGADGTVTVDNDSYTISDASNCGGLNNHQTFESVCDKAQITISGDLLIITGDGSDGCGFIFQAAKQ
jgi:hypothetical protein